MGKVLLGVVSHLQALIVANEAVPVMTEAELLVGAACKERTGEERKLMIYEVKINNIQQLLCNTRVKPSLDQ